MSNILIIFYWILSVLILAMVGVIIYHIWIYYLNKVLAIFTIALFLAISSFLFLINLNLASKVDWNILSLFF